jgi:hypothetical protein
MVGAQCLKLQTFETARRFRSTQIQQLAGDKVADFNIPDQRLFWANKSATNF